MTRFAACLLGSLLAALCAGCGFANGDVFTPFGPTGGPALPAPTVVTSLSQASAEWSRYGEAVAWLDWNDDGIGDALIGAPGEPVGREPEAGVVELHLGRNDGTFQHVRTFTCLDWSVLPSAGAQLGAAITVGDWDGDGRTDFALGAPGETVDGMPGAGRLYFVFNTPGGEGFTVGPFADPSGPSPEAAFGEALAGGRVDGNAIDDLVVAAPGAPFDGEPGVGHVVVFYDAQRAPFGLDVSLPVRSEEPEADARFGAALAVGDLTNDGAPEVIIGAPDASGGAGGRVETWRLLAPNAPLHVLTTKASTRNPPTGKRVGFGSFVVLGDVNADGVLDLAVGAPQGEHLLMAATGFVDVFTYDPVGLRFRALGRLYDLAPGTGTRFGAQLAFGDFDGDTHRDLAVAAPDASVPLMERAGRVIVFHGDGAGGLFQPQADDRRRSSHPHPGARFGASLAAWDDADRSQLLIGAPGTGITPQTPGRVQLLAEERP